MRRADDATADKTPALKRPGFPGRADRQTDRWGKRKQALQRGEAGT